MASLWDFLPGWQPKVGMGFGQSPNPMEQLLIEMSQTPPPNPWRQPRKNEETLPKDPKAPESPSRVLAPGQQDTPPPQAQPEPQPSPIPSASIGDALSPPQLTPSQRIPRGMVSDSDAIRTLMLQAGLNLMVPQWGGPLANIAQAFGGGAEAVGRQQTALDEAAQAGQEAEKGALQNKALSSLITQRDEAAETSRSKRLKGAAAKKGAGSEFERLAEQLSIGPKGRLLLKAEIKNLDDPLNDDGLTVEERLNTIIEKALAADSEGGAADSSTKSTAKGSPVGTRKLGRDGIFEKIKVGPDTDESTWKLVK